MVVCLLLQSLLFGLGSEVLGCDRLRCDPRETIVKVLVRSEIMLDETTSGQFVSASGQSIVLLCQFALQDVVVSLDLSLFDETQVSAKTAHGVTQVH